MPPQTGSAERLSRIEDKLDRLSELVISMARAEEKISTLDRSNTTLMSNMLSMEERMSTIEINTAVFVKAHSNLSKVFWSVLTSCATGLVIWFFTKHFHSL